MEGIPDDTRKKILGETDELEQQMDKLINSTAFEHPPKDAKPHPDHIVLAIPAETRHKFIKDDLPFDGIYDHIAQVYRKDKSIEGKYYLCL